ncbi:hypothetical protein ACQEU3_31870 [Spirillospora sp. CA-253888]
MRKLLATTAALSLSGALVLGATPAQAAAKPKPAPKPTAKTGQNARQLPPHVLAQLPPNLPPQLRQAAEDTIFTPGWDEKGPYIVWGNMRCRIHLFVPEEWKNAWGTGPCWF